MAPGVSQGVAIARCREIAEAILPPGYKIVPLGNAQAMQQTLTSLGFALGLGVVIAYMVLGVQFNSFLHPVTVLLAMPFAATGALATLWFTGDTLNLMSMIGLILLMGLVKKNSIILVDYTNQLRAGFENPDGTRSEGLGLVEAVLTACPVRLRPILMTSIATIAAAVPLAVGLGPGSETRAPLARAIIGGIALSTLITLVVVPVFYVMFEQLTQRLGRGERRQRETRRISVTTSDSKAKTADRQVVEVSW
jgi:HAE1 family hydrophobic/amphiphilic exporter-1